ncbi:hypothetical protein OAD55_05905 [Planktomarina temperata]|nr:hypothetical protein [Planktomarina temperata]
MKKFIFILAASFSLLGSGVLAGKDCTNTSTRATHLGPNTAALDEDRVSPVDGYCYHTPQTMEVKIYEFGLCTGAASPLSRSSNCSTLFSAADGKVVNLSVGSSLPLSDGITLDEGTYTHGYLLVSNLFKIKSVIEFSTDRVDDTGGTGKFCYTDSRSVNDGPQSVLSCGADASAAVASSERSSVGYTVGGVYTSKQMGYGLVMGGETILTDLYMTTADGVEAQNAGQEAAFFASQTLVNEVIITPNTTELDIAFSITDGVVLGFGIDFGSGIAGAQTGPNDAMFEGLKFKITAK